MENKQICEEGEEKKNMTMNMRRRRKEKWYEREIISKYYFICNSVLFEYLIIKNRCQNLALCQI